MITFDPLRKLTRHQALVSFEGAVHRWLVAHSIVVLRISLGLVFLGFGLLKFVPGLSPAEDLVRATISVMTFGVVTGHLGVVITAVIECFIGATLIVGRWIRLTIYVLAAELLGILSPVLLLPGRLFDGPLHAPSLEGQYVLKDIVLVGAAMVVATQFRGAVIVAPDDWQLDTTDAGVGTTPTSTPTPTPTPSTSPHAGAAPRSEHE